MSEIKACVMRKGSQADQQLRKHNRECVPTKLGVGFELLPSPHFRSIQYDYFYCSRCGLDGFRAERTA